MERSLRFYSDVLGFKVSGRANNDQMVFLTATGENHHDLALARISPEAETPGWGHTGLYHFAIQVADDAALREARDRLAAAGALSGASDHGVSHSLYGVDPDGTEFEVYADTSPAERHGEVAELLGQRPQPLRI
jgi:catechol-2,3-dioxygenase